jgi:predicted metal-dependent enzyme (double-stranded beta helix superfamily)
MFDREQFIADCRSLLGGERAAHGVREIVARAVSDPAELIRELGEPKQGGINCIHRSPELTIINVIWPIGQILMPHNHALWAVIGIYTGREDNIFWRRLPGAPDGSIEAAGAKTLGETETIAFGAEVIHSVVNPVPRLTGAIHVYGGDFFGVSRSEWDPDALREKPYDMEKVLRMFASQRA